MTEFLQLFVSGVALGAVYALVALGFVVIYRASQVFNFAQGEFLTFGAFMMVTFSGAGLPWPLALAATMLATGALAAAVERGVLRPLVGRSVVASIILTIFVGSVVRVAIILIWGTDARGMPTPWNPMSSVSLGGANVLFNSLGAMLAGGLALGAFFFVLKRTKLGVAMRATSSDQEAALSLGIPVGRIFGSVWFLAGMYAALGGVFLGAFPNTVTPNLGFIALRAFPAAIVGGLDSAGGTVIAALLLGVLEVLTQGYINPLLGTFGQNFHAVLPYLIMVGFLMFRPYGIAGRPLVERV